MTTIAEATVKFTGDTADLDRANTKAKQSTEQLDKQFAGLTKSTQGLGKAKEQLTASTAKVGQAMQQTTASTGRLTQSVTQARAAVGSLGSSFAGFNIGLGVARAGLVALANPLTAVILGFAALAVGMAIGGERMANLQNMFLGTARSVEELSGSFQLVTALARATGQSAEQLAQRYNQLTQQGRALGLTQEEINRNLQDFERAVAGFRVPTIAAAARGASDAFFDMLAGFDRLLGVSQTIVNLFNSIRDLIQTIGRWLPAQATAAERLTAEQTQHNRLIARHQQHIDEINRGMHDFWLQLNENNRGLGIEEMRLRAIHDIQAEITRLRGFRTEVFPAVTPEQRAIIDGITRQLQHERAAARENVPTQELLNRLFQIRLQLLQAGVTNVDEQLRLFRAQLEEIQRIERAHRNSAAEAQNLVTALSGIPVAFGNIFTLGFGNLTSSLSMFSGGLNGFTQELTGFHTQAFEDAFGRMDAAMRQSGATFAEVQAMKRQLLMQEQRLTLDTATKVGQALTAVFPKSKAAAIGQAVINTAVGITQALGLPWPFNWIQAAAVAASGAAQIASIRSASPSGGSAPTVGGGGGNTGAEAGGTMPQMITIEMQSGQLFSSEQVNNLMALISEEVKNGGALIATRLT